MSSLLGLAAVLVLMTLLASLVRVLRGPGTADRIAAAQLLGTAGIASLLLWDAAAGAPGLLDLALTLAVLAPFATIAMVRKDPDA